MFEALVRAVESEAVVAALEARGFTRLLVQYGAGEHEPFGEGKAKKGKLVCESYRFKPSLQCDFEEASLVVSHAGYGCLMESLSLGKEVIAVINTQLMDNHQTEIAGHLARRRYAVMCEPASLAQAVAESGAAQRVPLPRAQPEAVVAYVDSLLGL